MTNTEHYHRLGRKGVFQCYCYFFAAFENVSPFSLFFLFGLLEKKIKKWGNVIVK